MGKKFSKPELSRKINGDIPFDTAKNTEEEIPKIRLDIAVSQKYPRYSRATLQKFIKNSQVSVNGEIQTQSSLLIDEDSEIDLQIEEQAEPERPPVIFENDDVIVFNKPAGMLSINKGAYNPEVAIENFGEIVHRLDRDTSGVIIVAKNQAAKTHLQKQFQDRKAHKTYYAVTVGTPNPAHAIINIPLARNLKKPTTFMPDKNGREAITEYKVLDFNDKYALVELKPRTGRTHQLRIHLNYLKTPILGDPVYNPKGPKTERMFLHAAALEITIPGGERLTFTAELPESFKNAVR